MGGFRMIKLISQMDTAVAELKKVKGQKGEGVYIRDALWRCRMARDQVALERDTRLNTPSYYLLKRILKMLVKRGGWNDAEIKDIMRLSKLIKKVEVK